MVLIVGCQVSEESVTTDSDKGGITITINAGNSGVIKAASGKSEIDAAAIILKKGSIVTSEYVNLVDGSAVKSTPGTQVGNWSLQIDAIDLNNNVIYTGTTNVKNQKGITVPASARLSQVTGGLSINIISDGELVLWWCRKTFIIFSRINGLFDSF